MVIETIARIVGHFTSYLHCPSGATRLTTPFSLLGFGGEDVSKAIPWDHKTRFGNAGYVDIRNTLAGSSQGKVRQYGPLSFSRIYQAGHERKFSLPVSPLVSH